MSTYDEARIKLLDDFWALGEVMSVEARPEPGARVAYSVSLTNRGGESVRVILNRGVAIPLLDSYSGKILIQRP